MSKELFFFNKQGDALNIKYDESQELYQGDILFDENSNDTFKTYNLYTLERVPSFEYEAIGDLGTRKFQLFNEYGLHFYNSSAFSKVITKIEPVNNDPDFYSKWIYGENFESLFPIGTLVVFDTPMLEFTNVNATYVVTGTKKGAFLIISTVDNSTFENMYYNQYTDSTFYGDKFISGINAIGVYNYINSKYENNLSKWNEPNFYDKVYKGKKLNVVNTVSNDGLYTVKGPEITDIISYEYVVSPVSLPQDSSIIIEVVIGTDLPKLYDGGLNITSDNRLYVIDYIHYPKLLNSGQEFKVIGSVDNQNFFTVADMYDFKSYNNVTYFNLDDQVTYNGDIYQCVLGYTHSHADDNTKFITPDKDTQHWSNPTFIRVNETTILEPLLSAQIYLTKEKYYYEYGFTQSSDVTLAAAAENYKDELDVFNIDLYYEKNNLKADLVYPSDYAKVNFYHTQIGETYSIGGSYKTFERLIEVSEELVPELNYDISENFKVNIVFTDLDEYGLKVTVNKMVYEEQIAWVYSGGSINLIRTIDRTLRNWLTRNYTTLYKLGINAELQYTFNPGSPATSLYYNSIVLNTEYPNVPVVVNSVLVGSTADYYIEHSRVLFNNLGSSLNVKINNRDYFIQTVMNGTQPDIPTTLKNWCDLYHTDILEYGFDVLNINDVLRFNLKQTEIDLVYSISTGKVDFPGLSDYTIVDKKTGKLGCLVASNEIILSSSTASLSSTASIATASKSFEEVGFSTGMVVSINNTNWTWVNQEYNIEFLDPGIMNISYQGPFWGVNDTSCTKSPYITIAFTLGFGQTACVPTGATGIDGEFFKQEFNDTQFNMIYYPNSYELNDYSSTTNLVDIKYVQLSDSIFSFGDDLSVNDSYFGTFIEKISLPGNTASIKMEFNPVNSYLYCLSKNKMWIVDPSSNQVLQSYDLFSDAYDMLINSDNGDVYITYSNANKVDVYYSNNYTMSASTTILTNDICGKIVHNVYEKDIYITSIDSLIRINGTTRSIKTTYSIVGIKPIMFYEPIENSIYYYDASYLMKINDGIISSTTIVSESFGDIIFNNFTGEMNLSDSSNQFTKLNLDGSIVKQANVANYGYQELNQYDGGVYIASQTSNSVVVVDSATGELVYLNALAAKVSKMTYNPDRKSIWGIQPSMNQIVEIMVELNVEVTINEVESVNVDENQYGTLSDSYVQHEDIWIKSRDYFRRPRENYEGDNKVKYYWKWYSDNVEEFFLYDYSGEQLYRETTGSYSYIGATPLSPVVLNKNPNKDITKIKKPEYQQTIFDKIEFTLSYIDDSVDTSSDVEPLQLSIGFQSKNEGALRSILQMYKSEDINFTISTDENTVVTLTTLDVDGDDKRGIIELGVNSGDVFTDKGLKEGQHIVIYFKDKTNQRNQYVSHNNGTLLKIREVYFKSIIVDFFDLTTDILDDESSTIVDYPLTNDITYLDFTIMVVDKEIGRFFTYGQTEEEDERFKIELGNTGKLVAPEDIFIFKEYDIEEGGIDWIYLNKKRKEMLLNKHLIYPYIGSYVSIINAINFFGYNDLQLNEYYRNVDPSSVNFTKLFKVEIPDIFDNSVDGWTENDFIKHTMPNDNFEVTNMFNLTYFITDIDGENILNYSLDEVIIKLQGLKYWLKKNIIPLTHKILDITGRAYLNSGTQIQHRLHDVRIMNINDNMTPVTFKLNEAYLMPVNSGSTVYNCVLDFYSIIPDVGADKTKTGLVVPPSPYNGVILNQPDYFNVKIRTYKTYKEWTAFTSYYVGDRVIYYDKIYESVIGTNGNPNKINSPRKYELVTDWVQGEVYELTSLVKYNRDIFVFKQNATASIVVPINDTTNWDKITEWKEIDWSPVQTITEYREGTNLLPFNFTIDSNLDPFIVVEVTSDNGYGCVYCDKKNYEIRGIKDLTDAYSNIEPVGPFIPITLLT